MPVSALRLGFLGAGWIGRNRLEAIVGAGAGAVAAVADAAPDVAARVVADHGGDVVAPDRLVDEADRLGLDGVVIATPSALHADQAIAALDRGLPVFCQKPLGRTAAECAAVVDAARRADRLLAVDLSYRHLAAVGAVREQLSAGSIGDVYAVDLVFHNAYGPDKAWFTDPALSGGGCVIDLGIHLVDLALWLLGDGAKVDHVSSRLFVGGRPLDAGAGRVEDHALAQLDLADGTALSLACSWFLHAGCDAVIRANFHGTTGTLEVANVGGSFYDFEARLHRGTSTSTLVHPPDDWGGRAVISWARRVAEGARFDPGNDDVVAVASVLDRIYGRDG